MAHLITRFPELAAQLHQLKNTPLNYLLKNAANSLPNHWTRYQLLQQPPTAFGYYAAFINNQPTAALVLHLLNPNPPPRDASIAVYLDSQGRPKAHMALNSVPSPEMRLE